MTILGRLSLLALVAALIPSAAFANPGSVTGYGNVGVYGGKVAPGGGGGVTPGAGSPFVPKGQPWILQAAPWYLYWPYDAHFQTPAPVFAPYHAPHTLGAIPPQSYYPGYGTVPYGAGVNPYSGVAPGAYGASPTPAVDGGGLPPASR